MDAPPLSGLGRDPAGRARRYVGGPGLLGPLRYDAPDRGFSRRAVVGLTFDDAIPRPDSPQPLAGQRPSISLTVG